jgi:hypothetical protein
MDGASWWWTSARTLSTSHLDGQNLTLVLVHGRHLDGVEGLAVGAALGWRVVKSTTGSGTVMATRTMAEVSTGKRTMASFQLGPIPCGIRTGVR